MGLFSFLSRLKAQKAKLRVLVLGLDNAGKSTILASLADEEISTVTPTAGLNIKTVQHQKYELTMWDIGGQKSIRKYWKKYYKDTDAVIYVVDSSDVARIGETYAEFCQLLLEPQLSGHPVLVFANKQDLSSALTQAKVAEELHLPSISDRPWQIQACCAKTGEGLKEGMEWMLEAVSVISSK
ncbi:Arl3a [Monocercomonoides exilis]|uniref:Arl3a n=1 Tax=Monocercomonoides exilis TaxID=2049356 RepID=UPI003559AE30|nr:Arl3a [Monocercomonoides exilis]|eukprot:MONOS_12559.1-p1 / transcript=MONOS_12559.1 / gene=MONOS_12559 / organism=Monocercomonoides_exilis_PA203 / gene_product=Arl3a / transcript_product=Arl3a / location=Mono_scaffold00702:4160-4831(-) / protein_length=183 / sequence_SO=supercontig / SO=protein_coding / is_pseudo=false